MKRYTAIFFLSIYLMSFTECHQFVRIPFMVEHFRQHKAIDPSMDFVKFIQIHYFSANIVTDDFLQDQQLPFRSVECHMQNITVYIQGSQPLEFHVPVSIAKEYPSYNEINKPQFSVFDIFQPPRCA
ncbi:MAG: hypothetical protein JST63_12915 [Bacteroidetes bacterium]|nr:hypothetical protein [Bacteroidota bacterium]